MEKQTYTARLSLNIRSDDSDGKLPDGSMYELHYKKDRRITFSTSTWYFNTDLETNKNQRSNYPSTTTRPHANKNFNPQMNADKKDVNKLKNIFIWPDSQKQRKYFTTEAQSHREKHFVLLTAPVVQLTK